MTEIDVPDWVVEVAMAAGDQFASENTASMYATVRDLRREEMRTSITAALGAWVVPVYQIRSQVQRSWVEVKPDSYALILSDNDDEFYEGRILYTLRQEKPE